MRSKSSLTPTPPALSRPQPPRYAYLLARYEPFVGSKTECFPRSQGTCFVVPPPGETNGNGETAEQALAECQARCNRNPNRCRAVVVVPVAKPAAVAFQVRCLPPQHPSTAACLPPHHQAPPAHHHSPTPPLHHPLPVLPAGGRDAGAVGARQLPRRMLRKRAPGLAGELRLTVRVRRAPRLTPTLTLTLTLTPTPP